MNRVLLCVLLAGLTACARPVLTCGASDGSVVANLECRATGGDKEAALALGRRHALGAGVKKDVRRAAKLYRQAASFTAGTTYVYSPPVGKNGRGTVIPVRTGPDRVGLPDAKFRLGVMYLEGRGVGFDFAKGRKLLEEAADGGSADARAKLRELDGSPRT